MNEGGREGRLGEAVYGRLRVLHATGAVMAMENTYAMGGRSWSQKFTAHRLGEPQLSDELARAGLRLDRWLDDRRSWFVALAGP
ncbi:hypothetical protein [Actinoplanes sp. HUAS TT8]|uniref:hypothetical protein n=1 Tax=Actinoplanes sp. HUAS TT8 TaxID=3447453 RepID=UPI003F51DDC9